MASETFNKPDPRPVLVAGATGYIGGRLVRELLRAGHPVRCLARSPHKLDAASWRDDVEIVAGDVTDPAGTAAAMAGCRAAYFLVHAIGEGPDWERTERAGARAFQQAAADARLEQIVYLGGLGGADADLSPHLASRREVGRILADGPVPVTELRAAVIIGSGSASFEMLRNLVEVLPAMVTPKWVDTRCQPIAVRDVLAYLTGVLDLEGARGRVLEVGGPDVLTYREMMRQYAEVARLPRRLVIPVPVLSPRLSSLWIGLVTPLPTSLARPLVDSLVNEVVVHDPAITELLPRRLLSYRESVELALRQVADLHVATRWSDASTTPEPAGPAGPMATDPDWSGGAVLEDVRQISCAATPTDVFATVAGIGGGRGWYGSGWLWNLRGLVDLAVGGVGPRRGRRHPRELRVGDAVDSFRVEALEAPHLLRLRAEMRMPGEGWLEWSVATEGAGTRLTQRARYHPHGLLGRLYWWVLIPAHALVFTRMLRSIAAAADRTSSDRSGVADGRVRACGDARAARDAPGRRRERGRLRGRVPRPVAPRGRPGR